MKTNNTKIDGFLFNFINLFLIGYITISQVFPPIRVLVGNNTLIVSVFMVMWFFFSFIYVPKFYLKLTYHRLITLIYIIYTFLMPYLFGNSIIGNRYLNIAPIFFLYIVYEFNCHINKRKNIVNIIKITIPFMMFTIVKTILGLINNPYLSRSIKSSGEYTNNLFREGIGGYEFIYFLVLLVPVLFYIIIFTETHKKIQKIFLISLFVIIMSTIILSNYFTALIVTLLSMSFIIIFGVFKKNIYVVIFLLLISSIFLLVVGKDLLIDILNILMVIIKDTPASLNLSRINEFKQSLMNGNEQLVGTSRWDLINISINSFLEHPFFGTSIGFNSTGLNNFSVVGQHSHIIDTFSLLGFIPGATQIYIIVQPFYKRMKSISSFNLSIAMLSSVLIIYGLNTVTPSMGIVTGLVFPLVYDKNQSGK